MNNVIEFPMERRKQQMSEQATVNTAVSNGEPVTVIFNEKPPIAEERIPLTPEKEAEIKKLLAQISEMENNERMPEKRFAKHLYMSDLIPPDIHSVIYNEAIDEARENLDKELERMKETLGEVSVRNFSELVAELVMIAVDVSHAEGLSEGFVLSDDEPDF